MWLLSFWTRALSELPLKESPVFGWLNNLWMLALFPLGLRGGLHFQAGRVSVEGRKEVGLWDSWALLAGFRSSGSLILPRRCGMWHWAEQARLFSRTDLQILWDHPSHHFHACMLRKSHLESWFRWWGEVVSFWSPLLRNRKTIQLKSNNPVVIHLPPPLPKKMTKSNDTFFTGSWKCSCVELFYPFIWPREHQFSVWAIPMGEEMPHQNKTRQNKTTNKFLWIPGFSSQKRPLIITSKTFYCISF